MDNKSAVVSFIEKERAEGTSDKDIQHHLLDAGWHMDIIQKAMGSSQATGTHAAALPVKSIPQYKRWAIIGGAGLFCLILLAAFI